MEGDAPSPAAALALHGVMQYGQAVVGAQSAYSKVLAAAAAIDVQVEPQAWPADYEAKGLSPLGSGRISLARRPV